MNNGNNTASVKAKSLNEQAVQIKKSRLRIPHPPIWALICFFCAAVCGICHIAARNSVAFATFFTDNIASVFRFVFAKLTNLLPFSLAETAIICIPLIVTVFLVWAWRTIKKGRPSRPFYLLFSALFVYYSVFVLTFACGYNAERIDKRLGIERKDVSAEELYYTAQQLSLEVNGAVESIDFASDGFSIMPYSYDEMSRKLCEAYKTFSSKHTFIQSYNTRLKPVALSVAMSYAHTTGVYTAITGEANLNIDFPDYSLPYTAAHELAHQRGVSREDEANFIAFLVCLESDDNYIRYSGALGMLEYTLNALYSANKDLYKEVYLALEEEVKGELRAYSAFFNKYRESTASKVNNAVNDTYLKMQGTEGTKSYGMAVDLAVAYYLNQACEK